MHSILNTIDFANVETHSTSSDIERREYLELKQNNAQATVNKHMAAMRQELYSQGASIRTEATVNSVRETVVSQEMYIARMYVLKFIVNNPSVTESRTCVFDTWQELYPHLPYAKWVTNQLLGKRDKSELRVFLKDADIRKSGTLQTVSDVVRIVNIHYKQQKLNDLELDSQAKDAKIRSLELKVTTDSVGDTRSIWYRGIEIKRLSRTYKARVGDLDVIHRHSTIDPLIGLLEGLDKLIDGSIAD